MSPSSFKDELGIYMYTPRLHMKEPGSPIVSPTMAHPLTDNYHADTLSHLRGLNGCNDLPVFVTPFNLHTDVTIEI